jgi:hypothetical protein
MVSGLLRRVKRIFVAILGHGMKRIFVVVLGHGMKRIFVVVLGHVMKRIFVVVLGFVVEGIFVMKWIYAAKRIFVMIGVYAVKWIFPTKWLHAMKRILPVEGVLMAIQADDSGFTLSVLLLPHRSGESGGKKPPNPLGPLVKILSAIGHAGSLRVCRGIQRIRIRSRVGVRPGHARLGGMRARLGKFKTIRRFGRRLISCAWAKSLRRCGKTAQSDHRGQKSGETKHGDSLLAGHRRRGEKRGSRQNGAKTSLREIPKLPPCAT